MTGITPNNRAIPVIFLSYYFKNIFIGENVDLSSFMKDDF
jgi:hypothetical protein